MKSLLAMTTALLFTSVWGSPGFTPITGELLEAWETGPPSLFPEVQHFPLQELSEDGSIYEIRIGGLERGTDSLDIYLIGVTGGAPVLLACGSYSGRFNFAKSWAYFEEIEGNIEIGFQMPGSAQWYSADYLWDFHGDDLDLITYESGDPSLDALSEIDSLLTVGDIAMAEQVLWEMFYPQNYYVEGEMYCRFLMATHREAVILSLKGDPAGAVELFDHLSWAWGVPDWNGAELTPGVWDESGLGEYITLEEYNTIARDYNRMAESVDD